MRRALVIAGNDLKLLFRQRAWLFWIFVGPLLFVGFFGVLFDPKPPQKPTVFLVNRDTGDYVARVLTLILDRDEIQVRPATSVEAERFTLEVPGGAAEALTAGNPVKLVLHAPGEDETNAERRLRFRVEKALVSMFLLANPGDNPADNPADTDSETISRRLEENQAISIRRADIGVKRREITGGFQRSVPSYLVMFILINLMVSGADLAEERALGRLRRLFIAPVSKWEIVAGKLLSRLAVGWIQAAWMLATGTLLFKIRWAEHPWVFFGFLTIFALASASLGMLLGTLFRDPDKCRSAAIWGVVILSPLGGLWWPLEFVGPTMRAHRLGHGGSQLHARLRRGREGGGAVRGSLRRAGGGLPHARGAEVGAVRAMVPGR